MIEIRELDSGNLLLTCTDMEWLDEEMEKSGNEIDILWDGTEGYWANGMYWPFDAGHGNPFVGLSSAPCIAESMDVDDDGLCTINGRFWYFPDYMVVNPMQILKEHGEVEFDLAS